MDLIDLVFLERPQGRGIRPKEIKTLEANAIAVDLSNLEKFDTRIINKPEKFQLGSSFIKLRKCIGRY